MEASAFDAWAVQAQLPNIHSLQDIGHQTEGPCIGVDAIFFLEELQFRQKEPLAPHLGAFSSSSEREVVRAIQDLESSGCKVYFFFNGLDTNFDEDSTVASSIIDAKNARGIESYNPSKLKSASQQFKVLGFPYENWLCAALKVTLHEHGIPYVVAPFKAHAQMIHALQEGSVDALYGPSELFLYGAPRLISKIRWHYDPTSDSNGDGGSQTTYKFSLEQSKITWLELDQCLKMLGDVPLELFQDAMYLVGTKSLEPFPPLRDTLESQASLPFKEVVASLNQIGGNILQFCERYPPAIRGNWLDRYMRAHQAIKHMVILYDYETVKTRTYRNTQRIDRPPSDIHELVGLQLPAELHHYLYHGMIGPRVLNWLISGKIKLSAPLTGEDSDAYRKLMRDQLDPWRKQSLALLAFTLSHYWQRKEFTTHSWFSPENDQKFSMRDLTSDKQSISTWRVNETILKDRLKAMQKVNANIKLGGLQFAVSSLVDSEFISKTISPSRRPNDQSQLQSSEEITCNVLWRFLHLRGYVNNKHELTSWGKFLQVAFEKTTPSDEQAQSIFVIIELARLGLLDKAQLSSHNQEGLSKLGSKPDSENALIISYLACTGKLEISSTGAKVASTDHLLAYHASIVEIRCALRDQIDMTLATMFLDDEVERIRDDLLNIATGLPFKRQWSAGLGIVTASYFEELASSDNSTDRNNQQNCLKNVGGHFPQVNIKDSLKESWTLWNAFEAAVNSAPSGLLRPEQKKTWLETGVWFKTRHLD